MEESDDLRVNEAGDDRKMYNTIIVENPLKGFCSDLKAILDKHGIKSITPMYNSEESHIKILDDGRLSLCGMNIITRDGIDND